MIKNCEFAIGTYEINLIPKYELMSIFNTLNGYCKYIDTAVNYNNDYVLKECINSSDKIISKISPCHIDYYEFFISNHLKELNRNTIDIMLIHSSRGNWQKLAKKMVGDIRFKEIGVSNFNIDEIKEYKRITGVYPEYNEIEINPEYTDIETIDFCKKNKIKIIAYCILGGKYKATQFIANYSLQYLMNYAANYADIVIIRADNNVQAEQFKNCINYSYDITNEYVPQHQNKSMQPMNYTNKTINRYFANERIYGNYPLWDCDARFNKTEIIIDLPEFEMLGDYLTYIRYKYQHEDMTIDKRYFGEFLNIDNNKYLMFYMTDKDNNLTKVNIDADKKLYLLEVKQ